MAETNESEPGAQPGNRSEPHFLSVSLLGNGFRDTTLVYLMKG
jgi:hypothetical protein